MTISDFYIMVYWYTIAHLWCAKKSVHLHVILKKSLFCGKSDVGDHKKSCSLGL